MTIGAKVLITGLSNTGKTTLLKTLEHVLVISRDGKPFSLPLIHVDIPNYSSIKELLNIINEKIEAYNTKFGIYPETIVFDSISRIANDIEDNSNIQFKGFDIWKNVNSELKILADAINELQNSGCNVVIIAHSVWDAEAKKYIETCKANFAKIGGFLSTVDYAINIDIVGSKRYVTHRNSNLSRTLIDSLPDMQNANDFNLQEYLNLISEQSTQITEQWSI